MIDYDEQRIAELEALCERRAETISRREQAQIQMREERDTLRAELARVKAESLRVVKDGKQDCVYCGGTDIECIHCYGYCKPVRLERWDRPC